MNSATNKLDIFSDSLAAGLFEDDTTAPLEFLEISRRKDHPEPEKKLMFALLTDAVFCFQHYLDARQRSRKKLFVAADQWIFATEGEGLYAFESVCEHLDIDPNYLRGRLRRWKERKLAELGADRSLDSFMPLSAAALQRRPNKRGRILQ